ncbi:MAG: hypothetical protein RIE77_02425 [Phycisphaerales bacterium]|jgi:hypothetical protein
MARRTNRSVERRSKASVSTISPYRHVVVPGLGRGSRPATWQFVGCAIAVAVSVAGLAWVFSGGAEVLAWPALIPTR